MEVTIICFVWLVLMFLLFGNDILDMWRKCPYCGHSLKDHATYKSKCIYSTTEYLRDASTGIVKEIEFGCKMKCPMSRSEANLARKQWNG